MEINGSNSDRALRFNDAVPLTLGYRTDSKNGAPHHTKTMACLRFLSKCRNVPASYTEGKYKTIDAAKTTARKYSPRTL